MSGLPLLSGPPPVLETTRADANACRKCSKEFNFLLTRSRKCNHCGYNYCHSCTDYQGLMPRPSPDTGYEAMNVCAYCIEYLNITAGGRAHLKGLQLSKLKNYINAYNIRAERAVEKDDLIDAILSAKRPDGCLPPANEMYYRKYSVPDRSNMARSRGIFSRNSAEPTREAPLPPRPQQTYSEFARPDLAPEPSHTRYAPPPGPPPHPRYASPPGPPPHSQSPPPRPHSTRPHPPEPRPHNIPPGHPPNRPPQPGPRPSRSSQNLNPHAERTQPRPRASSTAPTSAPPPIPIPTMDQLLEMSPDTVSTLSVHILKETLHMNHVNAGQVLEKSELVKRVRDLVEEERRQRERHRLAEEQEERERIELQHQMMEQFERAKREKDAADAAGDSADHGPATSTTPPEPLAFKQPTVVPERQGLCVICYDEEACIAIVDCGHMSLCVDCSKVIMSSTRECPMCRTRIVTEQRLLRIFKT